MFKQIVKDSVCEWILQRTSGERQQAKPLPSRTAISVCLQRVVFSDLHSALGRSRLRSTITRCAFSHFPGTRVPAAVISRSCSSATCNRLSCAVVAVRTYRNLYSSTPLSIFRSCRPFNSSIFHSVATANSPSATITDWKNCTTSRITNSRPFRRWHRWINIPFRPSHQCVSQIQTYFGRYT